MPRGIMHNDDNVDIVDDKSDDSDTDDDEEEEGGRRRRRGRRLRLHPQQRRSFLW